MNGNPRNAADRLRRGERVKFLLFWGHRPERDGRIGRGFLSQWRPAAFTVDGRTFATAEHRNGGRRPGCRGPGAVAGAESAGLRADARPG